LESREREPGITLELAEPAATIVHVRGDLDLGAATRFRSVLKQAVHGERCVVVDLSGCGFIDSVSIGLMLMARRDVTRLADCDSPLAVVAGGAVARTLDVAGADHAPVPLCATVEDALTAVGAPG
jgi:anti-anti-sigma factor